MLRSRSGKWIWGSAAVACLAVALGIGGGDATAAGAPDVAVPASPAAVPVVGECIAERPVGLDGMRVAVDGRGLRTRALTAAENAAIEKEIAGLIRQDVDALSAQQAADGTLSVVLDGAFLDFAVARIDAAGNVTWSCVGDAAGARAALDPSAPATAPVLEER